MRRFAPQLFAQLFCICLVLFSVSQSLGQTRPTLQQQVRNRHWSVDGLREETMAEVLARQRLKARVSIRNDFRQLQIVNNNLMARVFEPSSNSKISNKEIRSSLGEIKKFAERVGSGFGIPTNKVKAEIEIALAPGLRQLDKAVMSFVHNPLFQQPRVYDAELVSQAGRDLAEVLKLAEALRALTKED